MAELIEFETERLCLRQWQESDFKSFATLNADPKVMEYFPEPLSGQASTEMAEKIRSLIKQRGWGFWAVEVKGAASFIGFVGYTYPPQRCLFLRVLRLVGGYRQLTGGTAMHQRLLVVRLMLRFNS